MPSSNFFFKETKGFGNLLLFILWSWINHFVSNYIFHNFYRTWRFQSDWRWRNLRQWAAASVCKNWTTWTPTSSIWRCPNCYAMTRLIDRDYFHIFFQLAHVCSNVSRALTPIPVATGLLGLRFESRWGHGCLSLMIVIRYRPLLWADHSTRGVLPSVIEELHRRGLGPLRLSSHDKKNPLDNFSTINSILICRNNHHFIKF